MEYLGHESMTVKTFLYQLGSFDHPILEQLVEKIAMATHKFDSEVDLSNIIKSMRVGKFLAKIQTNKR